MARIQLPSILTTLLLSAAPLMASSQGSLTGQVTTELGPLPYSAVYAYELAELSLEKAVSDATGRFLFEALPAGLYRIIAVKPGFVPAVIQLARSSAAVDQYLQVQLKSAASTSDAAEDDFWSVRERIPPDVLRDLRVAQQEEQREVSMAQVVDPRRMGPVNGSITLHTGLEQGPGGDSSLNRGQIDLATQVYDLTFGLSGDIGLLGMTGVGERGDQQRTGASNAIAVEVRNDRDAALVVSSRRHQRDAVVAGGEAVDLRHVQVYWSQPVGSEGQTQVTAQYTEEENFYRSGLLPVLPVPTSSQSWSFEGSYTTPVTTRSTVHTGLRYRERQNVYSPAGIPPQHPGYAESRVDIFGLGGYRLAPDTLIEYGVLSSVEDGEVAFAPRAGVALDLGTRWQASAVASRKLDQRDALAATDFVATHLDELTGCDQVQDYCYQLALSRGGSEDEGATLAVTARRFHEAMRLYFDRDFFRHQNSLYVVAGDQMPEIRFTLTRRVTPQILASLTSTVGSGGGGEVLRRGDQAYENEVRFLITSVEAQFVPTATGIALTFQQLTQQLEPLTRGSTWRGDLERLQLLLNQDLGALLRLAADWALQLNMEVSRGDLAQSGEVDPTELYRRFTGGIAVRF